MSMVLSRGSGGSSFIVASDVPADVDGSEQPAHPDRA